MPKPLFLTRPAGLYVRFRVPTDLRSLVGARFVVRPLRLPVGDEARLAAACMGVALSQAFQRLRQGDAVDIKKAMEAALNGIDLGIKKIEFPNGVVFRDVQIDTPEDERQLKSLMEAAGARTRPPAKPKPSKETLISHQTDVHLADLARAGRDGKTVLESRHSLTLFLGIVGDRPVADITGDHCRLFFEEVAHWPRHASLRPDYAGMSVKEVLTKSKALGEPAPSQATLNKHRQRLSAFFNWLLQNKHIVHNPLLGLVRQKKDDAEEETGRPFTQDELNKVFQPAAFETWAQGHPHRWWVPMLGLYSGARVNELSQLYVDDIETVAGVAGYHINKRFPGQKIKTNASRRFVPLAQPLLNAGFLTYVEDIRKAGHQRLFPHLPNNDGNGFGRQMSKQFAAFIKKRGVTEEGLGMHAFRHTLATRLDRAGVSESTIARITGHQASGGILPKFYIDAPSLPERMTALAKFQSGVTLPVYEQGQFNAVLKDAHDLPAKWAAEKDKRDRKAKGKKASARAN